MLCKVCVGMLRGGSGEMFAGTHDLTFQHHMTTTSLRRSREADCSICIALANVLRQETDLLEDRSISIRARLKRLSEEGSSELKYCLDFELEKRYTRVFLLKQTKSGSRQLRTPRAFNTSSDEVFQLARSWITQCDHPDQGCKCAAVWSGLSPPDKKTFPRRLLDLQELRMASSLQKVDDRLIMSYNADVERVRIYLTETDEAFDYRVMFGQTQLFMKARKDELKAIEERNELEKERRPIEQQANQPIQNDSKQGEKWIPRTAHRYVTLSHCWGKPKSIQGQLKLTSKTEDRFKKQGIEMRELSKTFRDAILFACRLEDVGFIWIDSLCIIQPTADPTDKFGQTDWLEQSRLMDKIYRQSFLNISATAAIDGDQGLFFDRRPEYLWEDEINVNFTGSNLMDSNRAGRTETDDLTRCTLIDLSFWDELVERAPVNRRGWVLQERIMSPRVLHFCRDQVAWECSGFVAAEGHSEIDPTLKTKHGAIVDEGRLKDFSPAAGRKLRDIRLQGFQDPDEAVPNLYQYELWKRMVEMYSKMQLTVSRDKLIALSGIARRFHNELFDPKDDPSNTYFVGMWTSHLESQLLWQVEERYNDGVWHNPARRDALRAPSFSWACLDTSYGIVYPDVTDFGLAEAGTLTQEITASNDAEAISADEELFIKIQDRGVEYFDKSNPFGMVDSAWLLIKPRYLKPIILRRCDPSSRVPFSWRLKSSLTENVNLYLDAPESDTDIFRIDAKLYCMPVAYGERTVKKSFRYLFCLLLQERGEMPSFRKTVKVPRFKRVGITKLSNHADGNEQKKLMAGAEFGKVIFLR
ncbi:hypothetical protein ACN47E_003116 [Coniothyrium glycines]